MSAIDILFVIHRYTICRRQMVYLSHTFGISIDEPLALLLNRHIAVIEQYGIFSPAKRRCFAVRINIITLLHIT